MFFLRAAVTVPIIGHRRFALFEGSLPESIQRE
jgi:hypothetical protein